MFEVVLPTIHHHFVVHRGADVALGAAAQAQKAHERRDLGWWWRRWSGSRSKSAQVLGAVVCDSKAHMGNTSTCEQKGSVCGGWA